MFSRISSIGISVRGVTMNEENSKDLIVETTIKLINENKGDVDKVTIRDICERCSISVGLINYHFKNKDNLITISVQRIISKIVASFKPDFSIGKDLNSYDVSKLRLKTAALKVFNYLFANPSIARISIMNDYNRYLKTTSSHASIKGFSSFIADGIDDEEEKERISFILTSSMQVAFLKSLSDHSFLGFDFNKEEDRKKYIDYLVDKLY